jgi:hypothetical protein
MAFGEAANDFYSRSENFVEFPVFFKFRHVLETVIYIKIRIL